MQMLIQALSEYYDILAKDGRVLNDAYSSVNINYIVCLTEDGRMDHLIECEKNTVEILPKRSEKPGICANIIEHRALYLFGLNYEKDCLTVSDRTNKAKKSHDDFVKKNLDFLEGLDTPIVNAYRNFILTWKQEQETENIHLLHLEKKYNSANYAFCLVGQVDKLLHKDEMVLQRWESWYQNRETENGKEEKSQCAVTGEMGTIARIHDKIKGVPGGLATGSVLIGFNNPSESSYGNEQSYNSNISESIMRKYTKALNYLLSTSNHKKVFDDVTVIHWAMSQKKEDDAMMSMMLFSDQESDEFETDRMLFTMMDDVKDGKITPERVTSITGIGANMEYYMIGLKPNSSRLALKFIYKKRAADILTHIAQHQLDLQISEKMRPIPFWVIKKELLSPKSTNGKINPELLTKIFYAAIHGTNYPQALLSETVRRVKIDIASNIDISQKSGKQKFDPINRTRVGIIKACINRNSRILYKKEEFKMSLDQENRNSAYLCGRLFAILEKLQQDAAGNSLNITIRDAYFSSAASKPAIVFPKLLKLAQAHLNKSNNAIFYNKLIGKVIDLLGNDFPDTLLLTDQGRFMIGYYQQYQSFFVKKEDRKNEEV